MAEDRSDAPPGRGLRGGYPGYRDQDGCVRDACLATRFPTAGRRPAFLRRRDVLGSCVTKHFLRPTDHDRVAAMHRKQNSAAADSPFVPFGFVFGNSHADQGARESADDTAGSEARQCTYDWTGSDKWAEPRDCEYADTRQPSERSAGNDPRSRPSSGPFRSFCVLLVPDVLGALLSGKRTEMSSARKPDARIESIAISASCRLA